MKPMAMVNMVTAKDLSHPEYEAASMKTAGPIEAKRKYDEVENVNIPCSTLTYRLW